MAKVVQKRVGIGIFPALGNLPLGDAFNGSHGGTHPDLETVAIIK